MRFRIFRLKKSCLIKERFINMEQKTKKTTWFPFLALTAVILLCCAFHFSLLFQGESKLLNLLKAPIPFDFFGGKITYSVFYGIFYLSPFSLRHSNPGFSLFPQSPCYFSKA